MSVAVCSFESRRCGEMAKLISKFGGMPTVAPSMREIPLQENVIAAQFADRIIAGEFANVLFMTGVGARTLFEAVQAIGKWEPFHTELDRRCIIVRGPKPVPVLKEYKIHIDHRAPEPNTWREVVTMIDEIPIPISGTTLAVQEYGKPSTEFYAQIEARGAEVFPVPVYRWDFPTDLAPLNAAILTAITTPFDLVLFTSANQVDNVLEAAERINLREEFLKSLESSSIASIGPTCTERLVEFGLNVAMEPSHPKMAHLVKESIAGFQASSKRSAD